MWVKASTSQHGRATYDVITPLREQGSDRVMDRGAQKVLSPPLGQWLCESGDESDEVSLRSPELDSSMLSSP